MTQQKDDDMVISRVVSRHALRIIIIICILNVAALINTQIALSDVKRMGREIATMNNNLLQALKDYDRSRATITVKENEDDNLDQ